MANREFDTIGAELQALYEAQPEAFSQAMKTFLLNRANHTGTQAIATVTGLQAALDAKATPAQITAAINALVDGAPAALDTLNELAAAIADDANFAASMVTALAGKQATITPGTVNDFYRGDKTMQPLVDIPLSNPTKTYVDNALVNGPSLNPLRVIGARETCYDGITTQTGKNRGSTYLPILIAQDCYTIVPSFAAVYFTGTQSGIFNDITVLEASLQGQFAGVTPVYFDGGSREKIIPNGSSDLKADPVHCSQLGLKMFKRGSTAWFKMSYEYPTSGNVPQGGMSDSRPYATAQCAHYNSGVTTASSVDQWGPFTFTGTAPSLDAYGYRPIMLGNPVKKKGDVGYVPAVVTYGDSIGQGAVSNQTDAYGAGQGYGSLAYPNKGISPVPHLNFARSASQSVLLTSGDAARKYAAYADVIDNEYLINDVNGGGANTLADLQSRFNNMVTVVKAVNPTVEIHQHELMTRTTSANNFVDYAGQTIDAKFHPTTGYVPAYNAWLATKVADGTIAAVISMDDLRDPAGTYLWKADGITANLMAGDDVHPGNNGHGIKGALSRGVLDARNNIAPLLAPEPGALFWLDPGDFNTYSSPSGNLAIADKAGSGQFAIQTVSASKPTIKTYTHAGIPMLSLDGTNDALTMPSSLYGIGNGNNTLIMLAKLPNVTPVQRLVSGKIAGANSRYGIKVAAGAIEVINSASAFTGASQSSIANNALSLIIMKRNGGTLTPYLNSVKGTNGTAGNTGALVSLELGGDLIGNAEFTGGLIGDTWFYGALTDNQINRVIRYINKKYATTFAML